MWVHRDFHWMSIYKFLNKNCTIIKYLKICVGVLEFIRRHYQLYKVNIAGIFSYYNITDSKTGK